MQQQKINLYLPGGGASAIWQVGAVAAIIEKGYRVEQVLASSAGSITATILVAATIRHTNYPDSSLLENYMQIARQLARISHSRLITWQSIRDRSLWDQNQLASVFAEVLCDPFSEKEYTAEALNSIEPKVSILLSDAAANTPAIFPLFGNLPKDAVGLKISEIPSLAMSLPGVLPNSNPYLENLGIPFDSSSRFIDGDFATNPIGYQESVEETVVAWMQTVSTETNPFILCLETAPEVNLITRLALERIGNGALINRQLPETATKLQVSPLEKNPLSLKNLENSMQYGYEVMQDWLAQQSEVGNESSIKNTLR